MRFLHFDQAAAAMDSQHLLHQGQAQANAVHLLSWAQGSWDSAGIFIGQITEKSMDDWNG